jgi:hypothetical protein
MTEKPLKKFELCTERLETLEDVKKVLNALQIRIDTDNPLYEELEHYFSTEVVPRGYLLVLEKVGHKEIDKMTWEEIEIMGSELLNAMDAEQKSILNDTQVFFTDNE